MASKWIAFSTFRETPSEIESQEVVLAVRSSKNPGLIRVLGSSLLWLAWVGLDPAWATTPAPASTDRSPAPVASHGTAQPANAISAAEAKQLLYDFTRAQASEIKALKHRQSMELKELKASQKARLKDWDEREKLARHKFFGENKKGPERRTYIKDFIARRKLFVEALNSERDQRAHDQEVRLNSIKQDQAARLKEFEELIKRGERPPSRLWPESSY